MPLLLSVSVEVLYRNHSANLQSRSHRYSQRGMKLTHVRPDCCICSRLNLALSVNPSEPPAPSGHPLNLGLSMLLIVHGTGRSCACAPSTHRYVSQERR